VKGRSARTTVSKGRQSVLLDGRRSEQKDCYRTAAGELATNVVCAYVHVEMNIHICIHTEHINIVTGSYTLWLHY